MSQSLSVLIIEDHPLTAEGYTLAFEKVSQRQELLNFKITQVHNCEDANKEIVNSIKQGGIDIVFLDISLPASSDGKIRSGEDLGLIIKKLIPQTKIAVATTHYDNFFIQNILENLNPEAFLVKNDLSSDNLIEAIEKLLSNPPYYSDTVLNSLRKQFSSGLKLNATDRQLLYQLSIGTKMKDLPNLLPLSMAGIEKRKRKLKDIFNVKEDKELILKAKVSGFI